MPERLKRALVENDHRKRVMSKFRDEALAHPELSLGFSLFWVWVWIVFQNDLIGQVIRIGPLETRLWAISLFGYALGFFILGALFWNKRRIVAHGRVYRSCVTACMTVGFLLVVLLRCAGGSFAGLDAVAVVGGLMMGIGTAGLHVEWGRVLGSRGVRATVMHGVMGSLGAALLYLLLRVLPADATYLCGLVVPLLCMLALGKTYRDNPRLYRYGREAQLYVPWKFIITSFVQGLSFGVMWSLLLLTDPADIMVMNALCFALAALGVFVTALLFQMDFNHLIYQVGFLVMALGYALLVLMQGSVSLGSAVNSVGCHFMSILMWTLCVYIIKNQRLSSNWVFSWTTGSYYLGQASGAIVAGVVISLPIAQSGAFSILAVVMVFVILTSALFMMSNNNLREGWGMVKPGESGQKSTAFDVACELIEREYDLTPREMDILLLMARGRNRNVIGEQLVLSPNTVKTHMRNIYQKMGIHSQQELISLVDKEVGRVSEEDGPLLTTAF